MHVNLVIASTIFCYVFVCNDRYYTLSDGKKISSCKYNSDVILM